MANGVPFTINPDDYMMFEEKGVSMDYFLAFLYFGFNLKDIKWCLYNTFKYSSFEKKQIDICKKNFEQKWEFFIDEVISFN